MDRWEAQRHLFFNASRRGSELSGETSGNGGGSADSAARMSGNGVNYNGQRSKNGVRRKLSTLDYRLHRMESLQISDTPITSADRHSQKTVAKKRPMNCLKHVEKLQMAILVLCASTGFTHATFRLLVWVTRARHLTLVMAPERWHIPRKCGPAWVQNCEWN